MKKHHGVDPDKRLLYLLLRHDMELDQAGFAAATRTAAGQVSLYSQGQRDLPEAVLDRAAQACRFPRPLLQPALRAIRSFRAATRGLSRAERVLAETFFTELLALIGSALEAILEPAGPPGSDQEGHSASTGGAEGDLHPLAHSFLEDLAGESGR